MDHLELDSDSTETNIITRRSGEPLLVEIAWEVVNKLGGIYTVIRSKIPSMVEKWKNRYCLIGPYNEKWASIEFEPATPAGPFGQAVNAFRELGIRVEYGYWLVTGRPRVILIHVDSVNEQLPGAKYKLWKDHGIATPDEDYLIDGVVGFGHAVSQYLRILAERESRKRPIIAHFHEWMAGTAIPELRRDNVPVNSVFTTHATMLGRYLAGNDPWFYDHLPFVDVDKDAKRFNIEPQINIERAAAHGAHVFSVVNNITAMECKHLIGREPEVIVPNGLNIERFVALHEFQNLHREYKEKIHEMVMGHFFPTYNFDLDNTLYFFTSGRYEYVNKGFDLTMEALARLNYRMKVENIDKTIVMFFVTQRPFKSLNPHILENKSIMAEVRRTCEEIKEQIGERLFIQAAMRKKPAFDDLVDEYYKLRLRREVQAWVTDRLPPVVTHDLEDDQNDQLLNKIRDVKLFNKPDDPVKVVYHPEFLSSASPVFGMDYDRFVRGCHLGIFPSHYEPWGYTPLECAALGVPSVTSDVAGFGSYVAEHFNDHDQQGMFIVHRRNQQFDESADELTNLLMEFVRMERRERIDLRNRVESLSVQFDWHTLAKHYAEAHDLALTAP